MIYKVLVGNEHGGAAESSEQIIKNFINNKKFSLVFLHNGKFAKKFIGNTNNVYTVNSYEPPIITSRFFFQRLVQYVKFLIWLIITVLKFLIFLKSNNVKYVHTTNNHALLVTLISKYLNKSIYVISHWRCIGLASSSKYKPILHKIDSVICISKAVKSSLPVFLQQKSSIIYDGIDVKLISSEGEKYKGILRTRLKLSINDFIVGTIGSYTSIKCHDLLIDSLTFLINKNLNIKLILFGSCPNSESEMYLNYLKEKVKILGLNDQVYFLMDSDYLMPKYYIVDFDLFVGATWNFGRGEGFGLMNAEAMAQKLPVTAIDVGAAREIIINNETGFLMKKNDSSELAQLIIRAYSNRKLLKELGMNGFSRVIQNFDISNTINELNIQYTQTIKC